MAKRNFDHVRNILLFVGFLDLVYTPLGGRVEILLSWITPSVVVLVLGVVKCVWQNQWEIGALRRPPHPAHYSLLYLGITANCWKLTCQNVKSYPSHRKSFVADLTQSVVAAIIPGESKVMPRRALNNPGWADLNIMSKLEPFLRFVVFIKGLVKMYMDSWKLLSTWVKVRKGLFPKPWSWWSFRSNLPGHYKSLRCRSPLITLAPSARWF